MNPDDTTADIHIEVLPPIFRAIGPGDDVVVSEEALREYIAAQKTELLKGIRLETYQIINDHWMKFSEKRFDKWMGIYGAELREAVLDGYEREGNV